MNSLIVIFKESLVFSTLLKCVDIIIKAYKYSKLKKNINAFVSCFKSSRTFYILSLYANKKPYYRNSLTYRIIMAIAGLFNRLFGAIHNIAENCLRGSEAGKITVEAIKSPTNTKLYGFGLLFMSIPIGSIISLIVLGSVSTVNMIICWVVFFIGFLLVVIASCKNALSNSVVIKAAKGLIDLIG